MAEQTKVLSYRILLRHEPEGGYTVVFIHPETGQRVVVPRHQKDLPLGTQLSLLSQAGIDRNELISLL